jgi:plastocyanin
MSSSVALFLESRRSRSPNRPVHYVVLAIALLAASAIVTLLARRTAVASQPVVTIKMLDVPAAFEPGTITIKVGDTVEWRNVGNEVHHATTDPSMAINCGDVGSPAGAETFDSGFLKPGATFSHTFKVAGTYRYACAVHETSGMIGKIVVK